MVFRDALRMAAEANLDLVEIAPTARPAVCRIMDYGRFKYEQAKRDREARKKQHAADLKEVKMRPTIDVHDLAVKLRAAERFLHDGDKVKVTITFRGREVVHSDLGRQVLDRVAEELADIATVERTGRLEGRNMSMIVAPRPELVAQLAREPRREAEPVSGVPES